MLAIYGLFHFGIYGIVILVVIGLLRIFVGYRGRQ
jgi:hypothetical protein